MAKAREAGTWARFCWNVISAASRMPACDWSERPRSHARLQEYTWASSTDLMNDTVSSSPEKPAA